MLVFKSLALYKTDQVAKGVGFRGRHKGEGHLVVPGALICGDISVCLFSLLLC